MRPWPRTLLVFSTEPDAMRMMSARGGRRNVRMSKCVLVYGKGKIVHSVPTMANIEIQGIQGFHA